VTQIVLHMVQGQQNHRVDKSCWRFSIPLERSSLVSRVVYIRRARLTPNSCYEVHESVTSNRDFVPLTLRSHRELYMKTGQGFLLVFSITSLSSLHELTELRDQIIRIKDDPSVPIVLVGNKCDLEEDRAVSRARAFSVSQSWGNAPYYETSARRRANVDECFRDLCRQIIRRDQDAMKAQGHRPEEGEASDKRHNREHRKRRKKSKRRETCTIL
jgi:GTPase SAR1 family protein